MPWIITRKERKECQIQTLQTDAKKKKTQKHSSSPSVLPGNSSGWSSILEREKWDK
jgi:hypothetical protein